MSTLSLLGMRFEREGDPKKEDDKSGYPLSSSLWRDPYLMWLKSSLPFLLLSVANTCFFSAKRGLCCLFFALAQDPYLLLLLKCAFPLSTFLQPDSYLIPLKCGFTLYFSLARSLILHRSNVAFPSLLLSSQILILYS